MASVRKFIRHPTDIPIKVKELSEPELSQHVAMAYDESAMKNASLGGLAFFSPKAFHVGHHVFVSVPCLDKKSCIKGCILWCKKFSKGFEIGIEFDNPQEVFHLRMIEQICHIEHYRKEIERIEGRALSSEEAALEWIILYASDFPNFDNYSQH